MHDKNSPDGSPETPETPETNEVESQVVVLDVPADTSAEEASRLMNEPYARGYYIHRDKPATPRSSVTKEAAAIQFLRDNREMSIPQLVAAFKAIGFVRGAVWITERRAEIIRAERCV